MNTEGSWLNWLRPKCFFCREKKVPFFKAHTVHIQYAHNKIEKVKICNHCIVDLYRNGGVQHDGKDSV